MKGINLLASKDFLLSGSAKQEIRMLASRDYLFIIIIFCEK